MFGTPCRTMSALFAVALASLSLSRATAASSTDEENGLRIQTGHVVMEVIGEVNNFAATPDAPLGTSQQFGYVSQLEGVESVFADANPANQNESTALVTFFTNVKTTRVTPHGPFSIVIRDGTTTFYRNTAPASFSSPGSFQSGVAILQSTIHQQVIVDAVAKTFSVVNTNTVTSTERFDIGDERVRIGVRGDMIRTTLNGVLRVRDGVPPPTGHFAGTGVGIGRNGEESR
jgi:hypothetical protein